MHKQEQLFNEQLDKVVYADLSNYETAVNDFESYREFILSEKNKFEMDCKKIFF